MPALVIEDNGWAVYLSNWAVGSSGRDSEETVVTYAWSDSPGVPQNGYLVTIAKKLSEVVDYVTAHTENGVCDLRPLQRP
jgi:hypothetical protein